MFQHSNFGVFWKVSVLRCRIIVSVRVADFYGYDKEHIDLRGLIHYGKIGANHCLLY